MLLKKGVTLEKSKIVALHSIPGKTSHERPVLVKLLNNTEKAKLMRKRKEFKADGHRLLDDVTRLNAALIQRLCEHHDIDQGWYFNGSIYAKTTKSDKKYKFDLLTRLRMFSKSN